MVVYEVSPQCFLGRARVTLPNAWCPIVAVGVSNRVRLVVLAAMTASVLSVPQAPCAIDNSRQSPGSGCDLRELFCFEPLMEIEGRNRSLLAESENMTVHCRNRPSHRATYGCRSGRLRDMDRREKSTFTCNYHCGPPRVKVVDKYGMDLYHGLNISSKTYHSHTTVVDVSRHCPDHHATLQADQRMTCQLVPKRTGSYEGKWRPNTVCYHESHKTCTVPRIAGLQPADRRLLLGQTATLSCDNRQDRRATVRCSGHGLEVLADGAERPLTLQTLCQNPCRAAVIQYPSTNSNSRKLFLVRHRRGNDSLQAFAENTAIGYGCTVGYTGTSSNSTCRFNQEHGVFEWVPQPRCEPSQGSAGCSEIGLVSSSSLLNATLVNGHTAMVLSCNREGYELIGPAVYHCRNGAWMVLQDAVDGTAVGVDAAGSHSGSRAASNSIPSTCQPKAVCNVGDTQLEFLRESHMTVVDRSYPGNLVEVRCAAGYRLSTGRSTALLSCLDVASRTLTGSVQCKDANRPCVNPIEHLPHLRVVRGSTGSNVPSGESVLYMCRNNRLANVTSTCSDGQLDNEPQLLSCPNPCTRPTVDYVIGTRAHKPRSCLHLQCQESHPENATVRFRCDRDWQPESRGSSACLLVASQDHHEWTPRPTCRYLYENDSCLHKNIPSVPYGSCGAERPQAGRYRVGTVIRCACNPDASASGSMRLRCRRTGEQRQDWTWIGDVDQPFRCTITGH